MKILIAGFQHETNTFAPSRADWNSFVEGGGMPSMTLGQDLMDCRGINLPLGGFLDALHAENHEFIPVIWAAASPSAHVTRDAYERITAQIIEALQQNAPDAVYLDIHGAMVAEHVDDGEGELLERVRNVVGERVPVVGSLDLHANVGRRMLEQADALVAYRTYPHVDMDETGSRAAFLLKQLVREGKRLNCAWRRIPFLIPLNAQCTDLEPSKGTYGVLEHTEKQLGSAVSFTPGFPASDFPECGAAVWAYAQEIAPALKTVDKLSEEIIRKEAEWWVDLYSPDEAVTEALRLSEKADKPVVIADTQDNPGAGGNSNTTGMLRALLNHNVRNAALGMLFDPDAARAAHQAGTGEKITLKLGGEPALDDPPLEETYEVDSLSDGQLAVKGPMMNGAVIELGPIACLRKNGVQIVVGSTKAQMLDREMYRIAGIEPERMKILVNKSSVHFRADFSSIAEKILVAKAPGPMPADPADLPWKHRARGLRIKPEGPPFKGPPDADAFHTERI